MGCESQLIDVVDPHLPIYWLSLSKRRAILVLVVLDYTHHTSYLVCQRLLLPHQHITNTFYQISGF